MVKKLQQAVNLIHEHGTAYKASIASGIPKTTLYDRNEIGLRKGLKPKQVINKQVINKQGKELKHLQLKIKELQKELLKKDKSELTAEKIKKDIFKVSELEPKIPTWVLDSKIKPIKSPGVPTLFCSDWHWGEVVNSNQIGGCNSFNPRIARERVRSLVNNTIDLLFNHMVNPKYPGLCLILGGDMFSGDIHEELAESNAQSTMQSVMDLYGVLIWVINSFLEHFPSIFIPCVTGNHGRNTHKPRHKNRVYTNFDWLLYQMLQAHYNSLERGKNGKEKRKVNFLISDGADAYFKIYNHRYLLTHGDQFRGGDGVIGPLGPIIRGDHKKRGRQSQIGQDYDTLLLGHFHQWVALQRLIVNGTIKGADEYTWNGNFPFESPRQGLWITHPTHGITISMPVYVQDSTTEKSKNTNLNWVSVPKL